MIVGEVNTIGTLVHEYEKTNKVLGAIYTGIQSSASTLQS